MKFWSGAGGVAAGYWTGQKLQPMTAEEGWYGTGDIGALDAQGNLYFKGRKKDVIVTPAGMNIYPEDLESALAPAGRDQGLCRDRTAARWKRGALRGADSARCKEQIRKRWCNVRTEPWPNTSGCGPGLSGPRKIFRAPPRRNLEPARSSKSYKRD